MYKLLIFALLFQLFLFSCISHAESDAHFIADCATVKQNGVYEFQVPKTNETFNVFCDQETKNGGWIVLLNRFKGKLDFHYRDWDEYKLGFGGFDREYFIGLEKLHLLTTTRSYSLLILMKDFDDIEYSTSILEFEIANEENGYSFSYGNNFKGTEIGLTRSSTFFWSPVVSRYWDQLVGWQWSGRNSKVTENRLNLFGAYLKVGDSIKSNTMGFYNEETQKVHPLRSIKMLMRPVNMFRNSYGETFAKYY